MTITDEEAREQLNKNPRLVKMAGEYWARAVMRLEVRKRALELAVAAIGPQDPDQTASFTSGKVEAVAERLLTFLLKEAPNDDA
jgi:hypothetical protein